jgi:hypothetical protein
MYDRPICGRSTEAHTNLGDLQRDLMGVKSHPTKKKKKNNMLLVDVFSVPPSRPCKGERNEEYSDIIKRLITSLQETHSLGEKPNYFVLKHVVSRENALLRGLRNRANGEAKMKLQYVVM